MRLAIVVVVVVAAAAAAAKRTVAVPTRAAGVVAAAVVAIERQFETIAATSLESEAAVVAAKCRSNAMVFEKRNNSNR